MISYWQDNLAMLKERHPGLFSLLAPHEYRSVGEVLDTPAGLPTLRFFASGGNGPLAYNAEDPWRDTAVHLETVEEGARGLALCIGLGLGYGPLRLIAERPTLGMLVIIEPSLDLFITALRHVDLRPLLQSGKVHWLIGEIDLIALEQTVARIASLEDTHILRHVPSIQWREEVYVPLGHQVFLVVNQLNAAGGTTRKAGERFFRNRLANLALLRHSHDLGAVKDLFAGMPAVLVAAGPSLDRSMADLKQIAGRCVLFAVDSALAPLLKAGIMPDFVTSIDFQDLNFEKLAPFVGEQWPFSFISTIKVTPFIPKRFKVRHLFWAFNDDIPQRWVHDALGIKELAPFPFSVAHLSLTTALGMGCDPIILVGQDLGYTSGQGDHAAGTIIMQQGLPADREVFQVPGVDGGRVTTDRGLLTLQKRFEDIIAAHPERKYYNATVAGAHIQGALPASLLTIAAQYMEAALPVQVMVDQAMAVAPAFALKAFTRESRRVLQETKKVEGRLHEVLDLAGDIRREVVRLQRKRLPVQGFDGLPAGLAKKLVRFDRINRAIDGAQAISEHVLELTYPALSENDWQREQNEANKGQGDYVSWLLAEIERIDAVNQERRKAFGLYRELLGQLGRHLVEEEKYLARTDVATDEEYLAQARSYAASGEYHLARGVIDRLLARDAASVDVFLLAGEVAAALLQFDKANAFLHEVVSRAPERAAEVRALRWQQAACWVALADQHGNAGEAAEDQFPHLLPIWLERLSAILAHEEEVPDSLQHLWRKHAVRMEEWLAAREFAPVASTLRGWEKFGPRFPEVLVMQARYAAAQGETATAIRILDGIVRQNPGQPQWLALLARLLLEAGFFEEGLVRLQEAVALDPGTATLWAELGDALLEQEDGAGAAMAYERCYLSQPHRLDILCKMGDSYLAAGQPGAAVAAYEEVLARKPEDDLVRHHLVQAQALAARLSEQG